MKKSVSRNYIYNLMYQILIIILPIITTPYVSRVLGAEGIGIYNYTISISSYFILLGSLGISIYAQREIAYVQDDKNDRSRIFWEVFIIRLVTMSISMIIFYFTYCANGQYEIYYKILLLELLANIFEVSYFFQGMEEFKKTITRNFIVKIVSVVLIFALVKNPEDLWKYALIYAVSALLGNLSLWLYLPKYIIKVSIKKLQMKRHIKPMLILFIPQVANDIYVVLDKTMIGSMIIDKAEVGYYSQAQRIIKLLLTVVTSMGTVMLPRMSNEFAKGNEKGIVENIKKTFKFVYFLAVPMTLGIFIIADRFIPVFLGEGYGKSIGLMCIMALTIILIGMSNTTGKQFLLPTKRQKEYTLSIVGGALCNVIANYILIKKYNAYGAAIGTVLAEGTVTAIQLYYVRDKVRIKKILGSSKNYVIAGIVMFIVDWMIKVKLLSNIGNIISLAILIGVGAIIYITMLLLLKDDMLMDILNKIKRYSNDKLKTNFNTYSR